MLNRSVFLIVCAFGLSGCGDNVNVPNQYQGKSVVYSDEDYSIYDKNGLMAMNVKAYVGGSLSPEQRVATVMELARKNQATTKARMVFATLYDSSMKKAGDLASATLFVDKCGIDEKSCDGIQWKVSFSDNSPSDMDRKIYKLWWGNRHNYQKSGSTDETALKQAIAKNLSITPRQVSLFTYDSWKNKESFK
ncbi:hypothetical protein M9194_19600 [Vibrio sp. S4M6]|uniref:DUF4875 domain-containing protein n=1 Tax=Vibrio sinus TaxID=2946865 RepID=UPI00202AB71E|nr:hypothetical protein [Vibrio sinus]MCL9783633.1 hypothetical protein [Vibrio sinus]